MISKSSYINYLCCPRRFYLHLFKRELEAPIDALGARNIEGGIAVGKLAWSYFPNTYIAAIKDSNGMPIFSKQIENTKEALKRNEDCIAEASFLYDDLFCGVDLLKKDGNCYSIYEVKSSKTLKEHQFYDVAFQKYVLDKCGIKIKDVYILHPNKEYIRQGDINVHEFFLKELVNDNVFYLKAMDIVEEAVNNAIKIYKSKEEPIVPFNKNCDGSDGICPFYYYCHKDIPSISVKTISGVKSKAEDLYNKGIITIEDYLNTNPKLNDRQHIQIDTYLNNKETYIDKGEVDSFLRNLRYPLYYLDFETTNEVIPPFDGMHPKEEFPFQYSLHIEESPDGNLIHKEFLGEDLNCIRALAEQIVKDIPLNSYSIAYHSSTERGILKYLADKFPDLKDHLMNIRSNMDDLLPVFKKGYYYHIKQGGSNSIKYVMPALCPNMEDAYHNLPVVHNGAEALSMFKTLVTTLKGTPDYDRVRKGMLDYCCLDTLSMVEIMKVLRKAIK